MERNTLVHSLVETLNTISLVDVPMHLLAQKYPENLIRWSQLGKPLPVLQLTKLGENEPLRITPTILFGYVAEQAVEYALDSMLVKYIREIPIIYRDVRGTIDVVVDDSYVLEIKCVSDTQYKRIRSFANNRSAELVPYGYPTQLAAYSLGTGLPGYWVVYNKTYSTWHCHAFDNVEVMTELIELALNKIPILNNTTSRDDITLDGLMPCELNFLRSHYADICKE